MKKLNKKEYHRKYRWKHKREFREYNKKYRGNNKDKIREYRLNNREKQRGYMLEYYKKNKKRMGERMKEYRKVNSDKLKEYFKKRQIKNMAKNRIYRKKYNRDRRKVDVSFRLKDSLGSRLRIALKGIGKQDTTKELISCSREYLMDYLESQFDDEMSWANYGAWHIDHIRPCCSFDLSRPEEQRVCFHYSNLRPLWAKDNMSKNGKVKL